LFACASPCGVLRLSWTCGMMAACYAAALPQVLPQPLTLHPELMATWQQPPHMGCCPHAAP
jgi:hypothetical protein